MAASASPCLDVPLAGPRAEANRSKAPLWAAAAIFTLAVGYRVFLAAAPYPALGGDESVIGIMAIHMADGGVPPAFFYRQHYMGSLQALLAVPFVELFGTSALALRAGTLALYAGFFWAMFWVARRLVSPWFAVLTVVTRLKRRRGGWTAGF